MMSMNRRVIRRDAPDNQFNDQFLNSLLLLFKDIIHGNCINPFKRKPIQSFVVIIVCVPLIWYLISKIAIQFMKLSPLIMVFNIYYWFGLELCEDIDSTRQFFILWIIIIGDLIHYKLGLLHEFNTMNSLYCIGGDIISGLIVCSFLSFLQLKPIATIKAALLYLATRLISNLYSNGSPICYILILCSGIIGHIVSQVKTSIFPAGMLSFLEHDDHLEGHIVAWKRRRSSDSKSTSSLLRGRRISLPVLSGTKCHGLHGNQVSIFFFIFFCFLYITMMT